MLSDAVAIAVAIAAFVMIAYHAMHSNEPLVICRWCGDAIPRHQAVTQHVLASDGDHVAFTWTFCSRSCCRSSERHPSHPSHPSNQEDQTR